MKHYAFMAACAFSISAWGNVYDPPPLDPNPLLQGARTAASDAAEPTRKQQADDSQIPTLKLAPAENSRQRFKTPLVAQDKTRVAVLGYHNFSETKTVTRMLMRTSELRAQMERIRQSDYSVISMQEFLEWRFGTRMLPEKCILITLDDGWRSVYTDAYPIFKEFGYPFHLFLYTTYLTGSGDSMTPAMVHEMMTNGASIGSHSATHPYPADWKKQQANGAEAYAQMIQKEIGDTRATLTELFEEVNTYCYPGGYNDSTMHEKLTEYGYTAAFTVIPGKATYDESALLIDRYMLLGTDPSVFEAAMDFSSVEINEGLSTGYTPGALPAKTPRPSFPISPEPESAVPCTIPTIVANLSNVPDIDIKSVTVRVSGFGYVPHQTDTKEMTVSWTAPCRIYMPLLSVHLSWKSTDGTAHKAAWLYHIDRSRTEE